MARRTRKLNRTDTAVGVLVLAVVGLLILSAIVAAIRAQPGPFIALAVLVGGGLWYRRRRRRLRELAAAVVEQTRREAEQAEREAAARARLEAAEAAEREEWEVARMASQTWRQTPLAEGEFTVMMTGVAEEVEPMVLGFLRNLHAFQSTDDDELMALVERVQHIAPQPIAQEIQQRDAVRLKVALEERGAKIRIVEGAVRAGDGRREPIPQRVRNEVWRRDNGRCVDCGSRERLEYDHIVPVIKGGANTARNIELRCETCNRRKGAST